jgi:Zn-dependent membrane protease YugP
MLPAIIAVLFLALTLLPALWARAVLRRYGSERRDYPGSGGELARHLLDRHGLHHVAVESTAQGDHYDPADRAVRLSAENFGGRSLTAVTVAAHEVGHALQDHAGYAPLAWRTRLVRVAQGAEKAGAALMLLLPVLTLATRAPSAGLVVFLAGLASFGGAILVHLVTLPVELDASYRRALPLLANGYLPQVDLRPARQILTACAFTYVAASLFSVLNLWRWLAILRR